MKKIYVKDLNPEFVKQWELCNSKKMTDDDATWWYHCVGEIERLYKKGGMHAVFNPEEYDEDDKV
jgi:hypothetical protein